jgi:phosphotransferase system enzyme I (PtsI)
MYFKSTKVGIMVETPSAALLSDKLSSEVDFFSIGTNDLVQYTIAADRENENLRSIADPLEPSVLKLICQTIDNGHLRGRHVGMCGEMAADLTAIPVLLGMGLDEFSVDPLNLQNVRKAIRSLKYEECKKSIKDVLELQSAAEVREHFRKRPHRQG